MNELQTIEGNVVEQTETPTTLTKSSLQDLKQIQEQYTTSNQVAFVKNMFPSLNEQEMWGVLYKAERLGLNAVAGEVVAYGVTGKNGRQVVFIVPRDFKRRKGLKIAPIEWTDTFAIYIKTVKDSEGNESSVRVEPWEGGKLWGATTSIKRRDLERPITVTVPLAEYLNSLGKPDTMIKKVSESQAWSMAVPELGGVYEPDEMPQGDASDRSDAKLPTPQASDKDGDVATEGQINTIAAIANSQNIELDVEFMDGLTQGEAKKWIANNVESKK